MSYYCVGLKAGEARPIYDLFGVVNHHGLLIGGHYTSYVRCCGDNSQSDEVGKWACIAYWRCTRVSLFLYHSHSIFLFSMYTLMYPVFHFCCSGKKFLSHIPVRKWKNVFFFFLHGNLWVRLCI